MKKLEVSHKIRRIIAGAVMIIGVVAWLAVNPKSYETEPVAAENVSVAEVSSEAVSGAGELGEGEVLATELLEELEVKGRAPKTGYARTEFYNGWPDVDGCSLRQRIIKREVGESAVLNGCNVVAGDFVEPYTGEERHYTAREEFSKNIQIDHIVALSDAWQKGAQYFEKEVRYSIATDPLNLIAADASANMQKSDGDAATWLPANKAFRCEYVARQIAVKYKYQLWVTEAEKGAMGTVLEACPGQGAVRAR